MKKDESNFHERQKHITQKETHVKLEIFNPQNSRERRNCWRVGHKTKQKNEKSIPEFYLRQPINFGDANSATTRRRRMRRCPRKGRKEGRQWKLGRQDGGSHPRSLPGLSSGKNQRAGALGHLSSLRRKR